LRIWEQTWETVPITRLRLHPRNPRSGDLAALRESLDAHGFFGAIIAQKSTGFILVGNHRFRAACQRNAESLPVLWIDCDEDTALRILLADNRVSDRAQYDNDGLAEILQQLSQETGTLLGTGYSESDLSELLAELDSLDTKSESADDQTHELIERVQIVIDCDSEDQQRDLLERFSREGLRCRALMS
jgi:ParB-like chromosome segregation protein Spo0J